MKKVLKNIEKPISLFIMLIVFNFCFFSTVATADTADALKNLNTTASEGYYGEAGQSLTDLNKPLPDLIGQIVGVVLAFVGLLFLILIIWGGFIWMTAGGNEEKVKKAITMIIQAVVGLLVVSAAYLIASFVGETIIDPFK